VELRNNTTLLVGLPNDCLAVSKIYQSALKIRDFQNEDYEKLAFFLLKKCAELGMEKPPLPIECVNWAVFLGKNYKDLSIEDIELAISLSLTNELYIFENGGHRFTNIKDWAWKPLIILCEILSVYKLYQREKLIPLNKKISQELATIEEAERNQRVFVSYVRRWKDDFINAWEVFMKTGDFILKDPYLLFSAKLYKSRLITVNALEVECFVSEIENLDLEIPYPDFNGAIASVLKQQKDSFKTEYLRTKVSERIILEQFTKWKNADTNVIALITNLKFDINE
jgi:hypothetical protein